MTDSGIETRLIGALPRLGESLSVESPQEQSHQEQEGFIDRAGNREQPENSKPSERTRDSTVAGEQPNSPDCTSRGSQNERLRRQGNLLLARDVSTEALKLSQLQTAAKRSTLRPCFGVSEAPSLTVTFAPASVGAYPTTGAAARKEANMAVSATPATLELLRNRELIWTLTDLESNVIHKT